MKLRDLHTAARNLDATPTMPVLFVGHGNPMNAITENEFTLGWRQVGKTLPKPNAVLCISAHWETKGTFVTALEKPPTIHDFSGFPRELFQVQYPAAGSPQLADETRKTVKKTIIELDKEWGFDHGCWSVVKHLYPRADVPVIQMSLDQNQSTQWHYELAKELSSLRRKGVLIIGSGNIVHNLGIMSWESSEKGYNWATEANEKLKNLIRAHQHNQMIRYESLGSEIQVSIPTPEHYLPLLYVLGLKEEKENVSFFNDKTVFGSISMTSLKIE